MPVHTWIDRAHLVVHQAGGQRDLPDHVIGHVGGHLGGPLRPGDPQPAGRGHALAQRAEFRLVLGPGRGEEHDHVQQGPTYLPHPLLCGQPVQQLRAGHVAEHLVKTGRRADQGDRVPGPDAELGRQRGPRVPAGCGHQQAAAGRAAGAPRHRPPDRSPSSAWLACHGHDQGQQRPGHLGQEPVTRSSSVAPLPGVPCRFPVHQIAPISKRWAREEAGTWTSACSEKSRARPSGRRCRCHADGHTRQSSAEPLGGGGWVWTPGITAELGQVVRRSAGGLPGCLGAVISLNRERWRRPGPGRTRRRHLGRAVMCPSTSRTVQPRTATAWPTARRSASQVFRQDFALFVEVGPDPP